jgi:hypothetical protein
MRLLCFSGNFCHKDSSDDLCLACKTVNVNKTLAHAQTNCSRHEPARIVPASGTAAHWSTGFMPEREANETSLESMPGKWIPAAWIKNPVVATIAHRECFNSLKPSANDISEGTQQQVSVVAMLEVKYVRSLKPCKRRIRANRGKPQRIKVLERQCASWNVSKVHANNSKRSLKRESKLRAEKSA